MKFLIIQERGRHEKNKNFREALSLQRSLTKLNCEALVWGLNYSSFNVPINFNDFDVIINLENYDTGWVPNLSHLNKPFKILWSIDAHVKGIESYHTDFTQGKYDLLLQATKHYINDIPNSIWFPNCFDDSLIKPLPLIPKTHDIGYCGNYATQERANLINQISETFDLKKDIFVIGQDMVDAINSYKIHFNFNISNDINYRNFETIGCETALCTRYDEQYDELGFEDFSNCIFYKDLNELREKVSILLSDENKLKSVSRSGYELSKKHTYDTRASFLLEYLKSTM